VRTRCLGLEPRGYSEEEKEKILRAYRERGSKRAISRIFGISRCCVEPMARKKGRESDSVADGLRPAEENDVLELDECWTCAWKRSNKRWLWVALCPRTRQVVAFVIGDRSSRTCARLWSRIPEEYRQGRSFSDFWKSSEATASPCVRGRRDSPAGWKVQRRTGPRRALLRAAPAKAGTVRPPDASGLPVRTNAPSDDKTVRGVVQRSHHLTSTRYQKL
jgi:IS1 family transposase